jgi:hypothetical protein
MGLLQALVRFLVAIALCVTPVAASANSAHDLLMGSGNSFASEALSNHDACDNVQSTSQTVFAQEKAETSKTPVKSEKDEHCGSCCLSACAKHLVGLPVAGAQIVPLIQVEELAMADAQLRFGREPDPARKPPRS